MANCKSAFKHIKSIYVRNLVRYNNSERRDAMVTLNISKARDDLYKLASTCIKYNDVVNISTKDGNVIMISEEDYRSLLESLYLAGIKGVYEDIEEVVNTPTKDLIKEPPWK